MELHRGPVRKKVVVLVHEALGDEVGIADVLPGSAEFKGDESVEARLKARHQAAFCGFVDERTGGRTAQSSNDFDISERERRFALFIEMSEQKRRFRPQGFRNRVMDHWQCVPYEGTFIQEIRTAQKGQVGNTEADRCHAVFHSSPRSSEKISLDK